MSQQGHGLGRALLEPLRQHGRTRGCTRWSAAQVGRKFDRWLDLVLLLDERRLTHPVPEQPRT